MQGALGLSGFEGIDIANLGSDDVEGNDVLIWAVGFRAAIGERMSIGLAYERPLTSRRDIHKQRVWLNFLIEM